VKSGPPVRRQLEEVGSTDNAVGAAPANRCDLAQDEGAKERDLAGSADKRPRSGRSMTDGTEDSRASGTDKLLVCTAEH
jgi:hypothetical protein